ncbi:MAG TPA: hypothetical protein VIU12_04710 [Chryseolinea sp.]
MTAITTVLSKNYISVACDSMITRVENGVRSVIKVNQTKFVYYAKFKCIAVYWGLAEAIDPVEGRTWRTIEWLDDFKADQDKYNSLAEFVEGLSVELNNKIRSGVGQWVRREDRGIGIHIAGFENFGDKGLMPELYLVSNYVNTQYEIGDSVSWSARTIADSVNENGTEVDNATDQRQKLKKYFDDGGIFFFRNGDPALLSIFSDATVNAVSRNREVFFKDRSDGNYVRELSVFPIELTKKFQKQYYHRNEIKVGGKVYSALINKDGYLIP